MEKKKDFGKERKNAWVGSNLVLAEGRDTKYYASCFYIRYALRGVSRKVSPFFPLSVSAAQKRPIAIVGEAISLPRWTWVGGSLALAEGRDTKYYTSCFHIR